MIQSPTSHATTNCILQFTLLYGVIQLSVSSSYPRNELLQYKSFVFCRTNMFLWPFFSKSLSVMLLSNGLKMRTESFRRLSIFIGCTHYIALYFDSRLRISDKSFPWYLLPVKCRSQNLAFKIVWSGVQLQLFVWSKIFHTQYFKIFQIQKLRSHDNELAFANWLLIFGNGENGCTYFQRIVDIPKSTMHVRKKSIVQHVFEDSVVCYNVKGYSTRIAVSPLN